MKHQANLKWTVQVSLTLVLFLVLSCADSSPQATPEPIATGLASASKAILLQNQGGGMEGHTPRGFPGMGTGFFAVDNLNPRFPDGDGVQLFLTFDLSTVPAGEIVFALLSSEYASVRGMPLKDLGPLRAEEVRYSRFSPDLWDLKPIAGGAVCELATTSDGPYQCDLADAVRSSLNDSYPLVQFRLRLDRAGDSDGTQDLISFFIADSNTNQPDIFELEVTVEQGN